MQEEISTILRRCSLLWHLPGLVLFVLDRESVAKPNRPRQMLPRFPLALECRELFA